MSIWEVLWSILASMFTYSSIAHLRSRFAERSEVQGCWEVLTIIYFCLVFDVRVLSLASEVWRVKVIWPLISFKSVWFSHLDPTWCNVYHRPLLNNLPWLHCIDVFRHVNTPIFHRWAGQLLWRLCILIKLHSGRLLGHGGPELGFRFFACSSSCRLILRASFDGL